MERLMQFSGVVLSLILLTSTALAEKEESSKFWLMLGVSESTAACAVSIDPMTETKLKFDKIAVERNSQLKTAHSSIWTLPVKNFGKAE